jgi:hypothetical protein
MNCGCRQTVGLFRVPKEGVAFRLQCPTVQEELWIRTLVPLVVTHLLTAVCDEEIL